jgi:hypothetical protein
MFWLVSLKVCQWFGGDAGAMGLVCRISVNYLPSPPRRGAGGEVRRKELEKSKERGRG